MTLAVAEALHPNKPNHPRNPRVMLICTEGPSGREYLEYHKKKPNNAFVWPTLSSQLSDGQSAMANTGARRSGQVA